MRTLLFMLTIPALALAGAAAASPIETARQCPAAWAAQQCPAAWSTQAVSGAQCKTPQTLQARYDEPGVTPQDHVLSRAEIRAELDAIRVDAAQPSSQFAAARAVATPRTGDR